MNGIMTKRRRPGWKIIRTPLKKQVKPDKKSLIIVLIFFKRGIYRIQRLYYPAKRSRGKTQVNEALNMHLSSHYQSMCPSPERDNSISEYLAHRRHNGQNYFSSLRQSVLIRIRSDVHTGV
jgi:hypothetical protein